MRGDEVSEQWPRPGAAPGGGGRDSGRGVRFPGRSGGSVVGPAGGPGHRPRFGGHLTRARLPRRAGRRQAGNGCVAARHLLRSVSAARSGSRRGRAPGWPLRPLLQSLAGGRRSAQWDGPDARRPRGEPSGVPRPRGSRPLCGRGACVEPRPRVPSGSARCLGRGSRDQMPGVPGITT